MKSPRNDVLAISTLMLVAVLTVWLGIAGPIFSIELKALNDSVGIAAWAQAVFAGVAIIAVYVAATIPVRAENARRDKDLRLRSQGLALLLIPEIVTLKGEVETAIHRGTIYDPPIEVPTSLIERADELYILGEIGGRLLQTIGMIRGIAVQTRRFQAAGTTQGVPINSKIPAGTAIWKNNVGAFQLCLMNIDEAIEQLQIILRM
jgi:hypothetical protein